MPKRRPVLEFHNYGGPPPPRRKHRHSSRLTDESPRPPSLTISSRHRSEPTYRSRPHPTRKTRHKRKRRHHKRRNHRSSNAHHRRSHHSRAPLRDRSPPREPSIYREDDEHNPSFRSPGPSGYPDDFDPDERAVDPRLEHSFSPTGAPQRLPEPEEDGSDQSSGFQRVVYGESSRRDSHRHRRHRRHKHHRRGNRRRRSNKHRDKENTSTIRNQEDNENRDDTTGDHASGSGSGSGSGSVKHDEDGNPIQPSESQGHSRKWSKFFGKSSEDSGKKKKGKKRKMVKYAAVAVAGISAIAAGFVAKKMIAKRRKKKADAEAKIVAAQQEAESEAAGPYGGSGGHLFMGPNPLQLQVPKTSFSVKVPESEAFIVERGGKYNRRLNPGSNTLVPFVDRIAFRFSLKEVSMAVPPQQCYSRENISVIVSALLFAKVEDAVAVAYGVDDARRSLMLVAQICMRKEVARLGLEQMLSDRDGLGDRILANINRASRPWGVRCTKFEVRDLEIPEEIREAFARQAQLERQVRADILASQGANEAMKHRADGELHAQMRMSQAQGINVVNKATAEAQAISERGQAIAGALRDVAEVANEPGGKRAMHMRIAEQYILGYLKATEGQKDLPPIPTASDVADALDKGLKLLETFAEPGSQPMEQPAAGGQSPTLPPARPAPGNGSGSGHVVAVNPTSATTVSGSPHSRLSQQVGSSRLSSNHGTPQVQVGVSPVVGGTQPFTPSDSVYSQPAVSGGAEGSNNSQSTQGHGYQAGVNQHPPSHYSGPVYPQGS